MYGEWILGLFSARSHLFQAESNADERSLASPFFFPGPCCDMLMRAGHARIHANR